MNIVALSDEKVLQADLSMDTLLRMDVCYLFDHLRGEVTNIGKNVFVCKTNDPHLSF
jgi:hypothetical protein